jgi:ubiquinol-cytochrome c reductase iron-sulfur subunit
VAEAHTDDVTRRDFLYVATGGFAAVGAGFAAWPFIHQMNPAANVLALSTTEVDLTPVEKGQSIKVFWQGKVVFVRHRTEEEIAAAKATPLGELKDKKSENLDPKKAALSAADENRVIKPEWLILIGVCTHLGCIPLVNEGEYHGWFCPCHGSQYDTSGRIRKGPAPENLHVPPYAFKSDTSILIG